MGSHLQVGSRSRGVNGAARPKHQNTVPVEAQEVFLKGEGSFEGAQSGSGGVLLLRPRRHLVGTGLGVQVGAHFGCSLLELWMG